MPPARRVQLAPPDAWDDQKLLSAARSLPAGKRPLRPGDDVGGLVVLRVEPEPGAAVDEETEFEISPRPRAAEGAKVDLLVLLDVSESMSTAWSAQHTRLQAARESIAALLRAPGSSVSTVAIMEYAKDARLVAGPDAPASLTLPVGTQPKGRSATANAVNAAVSQLASAGRAGFAQAIVLLTDGLGQLRELKPAAERAGRLRIPIHSIVFAPEVDPFFEEIAGASGGTTQRAMLPLVIEFEHHPGGTPT